MKIYLIRHGETDFNRRGIVQGGGVDSDLNDNGRAQAQAFYEAYQHVQFDAIYASPLKRTHQTIDLWLQSSGLSLNIEPGLTELSWGFLEGKVPTPEEHEEFKQLKKGWQAGELDRKIEGGESPNECWSRLVPILDKWKQNHDGDNVLVCTHGRTSRVLLSQIAGDGMTDMERFNHVNTGLNLLAVDAEGKWFAEVINDTDHLGQLERLA